MLVCRLAATAPSLVGAWAGATLMAYLLLTGTSIATFVWLYVHPTYEMWRCKTDRRYPPVETVAQEIWLGGVLGPPVVSLVPALHVWLLGQGSLSHCEAALSPGATLVIALLATDLYEWAYHWAGHRVTALWKVHRHHHRFPNPTPFATIADHPPDNLIRSLYPAVSTAACLVLTGHPPDLDVLYGLVGLVNVGWGVYLHSGHEAESIPYDHPILNTSFQHHAHHAVSSAGTPYHTGFFVKTWDQLAGTVYRGATVVPAEVDHMRTRADWAKVVRPDYGQLLRWRWWAGRASGRPD